MPEPVVWCVEIDETFWYVQLGVVYLYYISTPVFSSSVGKTVGSRDIIKRNYTQLDVPESLINFDEPVVWLGHAGLAYCLYSPFQPGQSELPKVTMEHNTNSNTL
jgi:hypothetical protein